MKILVIGNGGREHALAHTFHQQGHKVFCIPGNPGTQKFCQPIAEEWTDLNVNQHEKLAEFAEQHHIDLTVVGPEAPLAGGIVDLFTYRKLQIFGPTQHAARLESSKAWSKDFMDKYHIPTARFEVCDTPDQAKKFVQRQFKEWNGLVIKPDGLTAGKGVIPCDSLEEAEIAIQTIMEEGKFGASGNTIIIEEKLTGPEVSILAFCDGTQMVPMIPSQDHKRLYEGDNGPNTGGVGAYAPFPIEMDSLSREVIQKTQKGLEEEDVVYKGVLYFGLMITEKGPKVLEFNCRFGDPETQAILPLLETDLASIMESCCNGTLSEVTIHWKPQASCCVVMTSDGYPEAFKTGHPIQGLDQISNQSDLFCFHSGTKKRINGEIVTAGGRVLAITGLGHTLDDAVEKAYSGIDKISFQGAYYRNDIAHQRHQWASM